MAFMTLIACPHAMAAGLPANVVTSTQPPADQIEAYIAQAILDLKSPDPVKQQAGRDAIVNFVAPAPQPVTASPAFMQQYSRTLNRQLPAIAKANDMRTRLNAAIATARIAEKIDNDELVGTITEFLKDQNEAVAIWAMKAARTVAPRSANGAKIVPLVVDTARRFPSSATVAYQALTSFPAPPPPAVIDAIHRLLESRITLYNDGVPPDPLGDTVGIRQLVDSKWWGAQNPAQQTKTLQILTNLANAGGQRATMNVRNEDRESLAAVVRQINRCVAAIAELQNKPALKKKMDDGVRGLTGAAPAQLIAAQGEAIVTGVRAEYPALTAPSPLPATKPSPTTK